MVSVNRVEMLKLFLEAGDEEIRFFIMISRTGFNLSIPQLDLNEFKAN